MTLFSSFPFHSIYFSNCSKSPFLINITPYRFLFSNLFLFPLFFQSFFVRWLPWAFHLSLLSTSPFLVCTLENQLRSEAWNCLFPLFYSSTNSQVNLSLVPLRFLGLQKVNSALCRTTCTLSASTMKKAVTSLLSGKPPSWTRWRTMRTCKHFRPMMNSLILLQISTQPMCTHRTVFQWCEKGPNEPANLHPTTQTCCRVVIP